MRRRFVSEEKALTLHARDEPRLASDTIFAVATGAARAAISIIRISGPAAHTVAEAFSGRCPPARYATLARLRDPASGETLDHGLVLVFEAARSEVGEDGAEFHLHGSPAVVAAMLEALSRQHGLRQAEPGEFARRAFLNGRMDLAQIEGLADLIDAETAWQRRQAQRQLGGAMRDATAPWRAALIEASADVETAIDFADDVDLGARLHADVRRLIDPIRDALRAELSFAGAAERVRDGVQVVIAGPPNAGKSTLLNALVRREAAIVSAIVGTTRDPIEVHLDLGGCPITLVDTAGLRDSGDTIEQIGVQRAKQRAIEADLVLWLSDGEEPPSSFAAPCWRLRAKADLAMLATAGPPDDTDAALPLSALTGLNLDALVTRLAAFATERARGGSGLLARTRHREAFQVALAALDEAAVGDTAVEILAEQLRAAHFALARLIGTVDVEDILDSVFTRFCIGK